jgi:hypothetical protein
VGLVNRDQHQRILELRAEKKIGEEGAVQKHLWTLRWVPQKNIQLKEMEGEFVRQIGLGKGKLTR